MSQGPPTGFLSAVRPRVCVARRAASSAAVALAFCLLAAAASAARAAEIVFADGHRETVQDPRQDSKGMWMATRDGHRTALRPGDVVVVVEDGGKETETIPPLADPPDAPEAAAALAALKDLKNESWLEATSQLGRRPTKALLDALTALAADPNKALRLRAFTGLVQLRTKEAVAAATRAILAEKDGPTRRDGSAALFAVKEIYRRSGLAEATKQGLADKEPIVRVTFATLAPDDDEAAKALLRADGLKHADHHVRESAAVELGKRGDGSGESLLVSMLARAKLPGIDDPALMERMMVREKVEICGILGRLGTDTAKAALKKAAASPSEPVRKAAEAALAAAEAK